MKSLRRPLWWASAILVAAGFAYILRAEDGGGFALGVLWAAAHLHLSAALYRRERADEEDR